MTGAPEMWKKGVRGQGVVIAVLDTGCRIDHPDLAGRIVGGRNFTSDYGGDPENFSDNHYHGTHVAGIIAAAFNGTGVVGMAPEARLLVLKVLSGNADGNYPDLIEAIRYATSWRGMNNERVRVITMSLGGKNDDPLLYNAVKQAAENDILTVCAAGNYGDGNPDTDEVMYPGCYDEVIQVGAVDMNKVIASFSNSNNEIDILAPGVNILSTYPPDRYACFSGTSMAAPHVAGAAALIISEYEQKKGRTMSKTEIYYEISRRSVELDCKMHGRSIKFLSLT
ncbi:MAG: S8 family peptidase [Peptococcaceae bacterium]|nr:S8 family peptidase [Peptococcaceae bacterium]